MRRPRVGKGGGVGHVNVERQGAAAQEAAAKRAKKDKKTKREWYKGCAHTARQQGDRMATGHTELRRPCAPIHRFREARGCDTGDAGNLLLSPPRVGAVARNCLQTPRPNATSAVTNGRNNKQRKKLPGTPPPTSLPPSPSAPAHERLAASALLPSRGKRSASPGRARDDQISTPRLGRRKPAPVGHACVTPGAAVSTAEPSDSRRSWPGRS